MLIMSVNKKTVAKKTDGTMKKVNITFEKEDKNECQLKKTVDRRGYKCFTW